MVPREAVIITNFVVAEAHALILTRLGYGLARSWLDGLCWRVERVTMEDEERAREIINTYEDRAFSYTDATTHAVIERLGIKSAFTFDEHFAQFGLSAFS